MFETYILPRERFRFPVGLQLKKKQNREPCERVEEHITAGQSSEMRMSRSKEGESEGGELGKLKQTSIPE